LGEGRETIWRGDKKAGSKFRKERSQGRQSNALKTVELERKINGRRGSISGPSFGKGKRATDLNAIVVRIAQMGQREIHE